MGNKKGVFDDSPLGVECPECGAPISATIGQARRSPTVKCPNGHSVKLETSSLDRGLKDVQKGLDGLFD
jgi:hypothetical protein